MLKKKFHWLPFVAAFAMIAAVALHFNARRMARTPIITPQGMIHHPDSLDRLWDQLTRPGAPKNV